MEVSLKYAVGPFGRWMIVIASGCKLRRILDVKF